MVETSELSKRLEELAQGYWESWHILMTESGWTLGPDRPELKMSPYLADDWSEVPEEGKSWVRGQVALVIHAIAQLSAPEKPAPKESAKEPEANRKKGPRLYRVRAIAQAREALKALEAKDPILAVTKLEAAVGSIPRDIGYNHVHELLGDAIKNAGGEQERQCRSLIQTAMNRLIDQVKDEKVDAPVPPPSIRRRGVMVRGPRVTL